MRTKVLFVLGPLVWAVMAVATPVMFWDLADRTQDGQMTMFNPTAEDGTTGIPVNAGDLDNDGHADAVISAITGDGRYDNKPSCGEIHVLFGGDTIRGLVDFANYNHVYPNLLTVWGRATKDYFGSNSDIEDFDGDGINDLLVAAQWADTLGRVDCGSCYIIWGGAQLRNTFIDVASSADLNQYQITTIVGREADDKLGAWTCCGDVNGDGYPDMLIGAPRANGYADNSQHDQTGDAFLLFGPFIRQQHIDLANTTHPVTVIYGVDPGDQMGNTVMVADITGDGLEDVILGAGAFSVARLGDTSTDYPFETGGAGDGPDNTRENAGEVYILPGRTNWPGEINLAAGMPQGSTVIYGAHGHDGVEIGGDNFGEELTKGDVNGDGITDLLIGAFRADGINNDRSWAGNAYLFYGRHVWPGVIDLLNGLPDSTTCVFGGGVDWIVGDSNPLADVNGDGFFDLVCCGSHDGGPYGIYKAGTIRLIFGGPNLLPPIIDLGNPPAGMRIPIIQGAEQNDLLAYWCTAGDFNNDGYSDIIPNVMHGDGPNNERHNAGDFHVISGEWLTNHPGEPRFLTASGDSTQAHLAWYDNGEPGSDSHVVYRRSNGSSQYDSVGWVLYPAHDFTDTAVPDSGIWVYRVKARSAAGAYSNYSNEAYAFVGSSAGNGTALVVNGIHWGYYGSEAFDFWNDHVLMGTDTFRFWDLYNTNTYPPGLTPIGHGTDSLSTAIFSASRVIWVVNGFDPDNSYNDGNVFHDFGPVLSTYLTGGGELAVIGKELDAYVPPELTSRAQVSLWITSADWTSLDTARAEHPVLTDFGKIGARQMSLCPEYNVAETPRVLPLFRKSGSIGKYLGSIARDTESSKLNLALVSIRPYRAEPVAFRAAMDTLFSDFLGHMLASPVADLTVRRVNESLTLRWPAVPGAIGYRITRRLNQMLPTNRATQVAQITGTTWADPTPVGTAPARAFYTVFPVYP